MPTGLLYAVQNLMLERLREGVMRGGHEIELDSCESLRVVAREQTFFCPGATVEPAVLVVSEHHHNLEGVQRSISIPSLHNTTLPQHLSPCLCKIPTLFLPPSLYFSYFQEA